MSGPFGSSQWMYNPSSSFYSHTIDQSLRFEDGDSARLSDTMGTPTDTEKATISVWVKRSGLTGVNQAIVEGYDGSSGTASSIYFDTSNRLHVAFGGGGGALTTNAVFRDVSAWYHILVAFNSAKADSAKRCRIYVNGQEITSFSSSSYPNRYQEQHMFSSGSNHRIGSNWNNSGNFFDGYMAEFNGIDGTDLTPSSFGETKDGIWVPKDVSGLTYGNNGFHLDFADNSAIGNDVSGNDNDFTVTGLVASDVVPDSPTNNFNVINSIDPNVSDKGVTLSEGNLKVQGSTGGNFNVEPTFGKLAGNYYAEFYVEATGNNTQSAIFVRTVVSGSNFNYQLKSDGNLVKGGVTVATLSAFSAGDIIAASASTDDNTVEYFVNGVSVYTDTHTSDFEKLSIVPRLDNTTTPIFICNYGQDSTFAGNTSAGGNSDSAGIGDFKYAVPSGAKAICSANLPEPAIIDGSEYFNSVVYTGNGTAIGSGGISVTGVNFSPNFVWIKSRTNAYDNMLFDSVRGPLKILKSNSNAVEITSNTENLVSFDSDGFTYGSELSGNEINDSHVAWNWKAGTAVSGATTGSGTAKTYTGSVNTEAGFSIIKYVGNGTPGHTIPHNLTTTPTMIMVKRLDDDGGWRVQHKDVAATHYLALDTTAAEANLDTIFNDTAFDSTVFTVGSAASINKNDKDYIAYCFTDIDQYLKAGVYTGNANVDGPHIHTGFRPAWVMVKRTDIIKDWVIYDAARDDYNAVSKTLEPNTHDTEGARGQMDFVSNGFKLRGTNGVSNGANTLIYLAFAEQPFKYANAR